MQIGLKGKLLNPQYANFNYNFLQTLVNRDGMTALDAELSRIAQTGKNFSYSTMVSESIGLPRLNYNTSYNFPWTSVHNVWMIVMKHPMAMCAKSLGSHPEMGGLQGNIADDHFYTIMKRYECDNFDIRLILRLGKFRGLWSTWTSRCRMLRHASVRLKQLDVKVS